MKSLLRAGSVPFELDPVAVDLYFHYQYVPEPRTPLKAVRKLDAGHMLVVDVDPWQIEEKCYWRMEDAEPIDGDPAERIRAELEAISKIVIRSDVPVGVALSGGLDSSAIAALAAREYPGTMHAFSIGYAGRLPCDEREDAQALADHLGMPFHELEITTDDVVGFFPKLSHWRDDPIADISGHSYFAVMKMARDAGVPVMLQGQGGDELFWGYSWVRQAMAETLDKQQALAKGLRALPRYVEFALPNGLRPGPVKHWLLNLFGARPGWQRYQRHRSEPPDQMAFIDLVSDFQIAATQTREFYTDSFAAGLDSSAPTAAFTFDRPWPQVDLCMTRLISDTFLRENGITQGDRLSMASAVELRLPLIDYKLVETVIGLRKTQTDHHLPAKTWLKAALEGVLPDWVMNRPKRGFSPPTREWHNALFAAYGAQLDGGYLVESGVLTPEAGRALAAGPVPDGAVTPMSFKALVLEQWCRSMSELVTPNVV